MRALCGRVWVCVLRASDTNACCAVCMYLCWSKDRRHAHQPSERDIECRCRCQNLYCYLFVLFPLNAWKRWSVGAVVQSFRRSFCDSLSLPLPLCVLVCLIVKCQMLNSRVRFKCKWCGTLTERWEEERNTERAREKERKKWASEHIFFLSSCSFFFHWDSKSWWILSMKCVKPIWIHRHKFMIETLRQSERATKGKEQSERTKEIKRKELMFKHRTHSNDPTQIRCYANIVCIFKCWFDRKNTHTKQYKLHILNLNYKHQTAITKDRNRKQW